MQEEFQGIVMSVREYKERDALIKVFTLEHGKQMFFVRHFNSGHHHLKSVLVPGTRATFVGQLNRNGLSFLSDYKEKRSLWKQFDDVFIQAYLAFFVAMVDAVVDDRVVNSQLFTLLWQCLDLIEKQLDIRLISFLFEIKMLAFWGVDFDFERCAISHNAQGPFDISLKYSGVIATPFFEKDEFRLHMMPNAVYLMAKLKKAPIHKITTLTLSEHLISEIRRAIDCIYDELIGIKLKSKQYIKQLEQWYAQ